MGIVTSKNFKARLNSGHYYGMLLENGFLVARESVPSALTLEISQEGVLFQGNLVAHAKSDGTFHFTHGAADASGRWSIKGLLLEFQSKYIFYLCIDGKISHYQSNDGCPTQMTIVGQ
ncbi:hypothetical protein NEOLI_002059 [Neolecta irregularis DAH-3]|uniref:Uncharacterized protein n=1 Tax=Neolecta irregularis (strain DAH-3) TaxID=1198029 RepID=A0A1U7LPM7_NEOID|nr:hypothetical protein NEOLI_002059 [Neolecta irregularis DAH-3]|eukprot:OLL24607.1 hypothetical protein NEOLI_002059 [Neolecta irregularis DAH-3]